LDILRWHLHKQGYEVAAARDGAEALAMIAELRPDLVILDIMMPVLDGIDVARRIKSDESRREVTVVFCDLRGFTRLTVSSDPDEVMRVLREYHAGLGELITQYEGTLEPFVGDGLLVVFNDPLPCPDHTERAVRIALDMRACVAGFAMDWRARDHNLGFDVEIS